ncbi:MAG: hypothetical protein HWN66_09890 [Candidatus Helarchaeota archaeon]|nr:hypothetical protein [Candidatus Helarchaeota archaeon]
MSEKKRLALRILLGGLHYCCSELLKIDPAYKEKIASVDAVLQWKSVPDGPNTYTIIKDSKIEFNDDGIHENPDFTMINNDIVQALEIYKGSYPLSEAIKNGDVEVIGDKDEILKITFWVEVLIPLIGDLTGR